MFKVVIYAAAILVAAISHASAQLVLFSGAGYVTAATPQCGSEGVFVTSFMLGSYLPANLGSNGPGAQLSHASLPQFVKPHAVAMKSAEAMTPTFQRVNGTKITPLDVVTFRPTLKLTSTPATLTATTPNASLVVTIKNGLAVVDCDFTLNLSVRRRGA